MENNQQMQQLLEKMERTSRQQLLFTKIMCLLCVLAVICSLIVMGTVCKTASTLNALAKPIQELSAQAQNTLVDISDTADKLAQADFSGIASQIDGLVAASQNTVAEAAKKLDSIDIETLNKAIKDLAVVVEPLARVSKLFG